jgi:hypothetical protein
MSAEETKLSIPHLKDILSIHPLLFDIVESIDNFAKTDEFRDDILDSGEMSLETILNLSLSIYIVCKGLKPSAMMRHPWYYKLTDIVLRICAKYNVNNIGYDVDYDIFFNLRYEEEVAKLLKMERNSPEENIQLGRVLGYCEPMHDFKNPKNILSINVLLDSMFRTEIRQELSNGSPEVNIKFVEIFSNYQRLLGDVFALELNIFAERR